MPDYPISPVVRRVVYTASAGVGPYAFTFEILTQTDIDVFIDSTLKTLTTDYTVTINANGTGSITFVTAPTATARVTIVGAREIQRSTDFVTGGDLTAASLNLALDQGVIFAQQNAEALGRAVIAPVTDPSSINMVLPAQTSRAGKYLSFNTSTGNPEVVNTVVDVTAVAANAANINTVSGISAAVSTVAGIDAAVSNVSSVSSAVSNVSSISAAVSTVSSISADVTAVAGDAVDIGLVAGVASDVAALGPIAADITAVAAVDSDVTALAAVDSDIAILGPIAADITAVSSISANVTTVGGISADVTTVAADSADIQLLADNIGTIASKANAGANSDITSLSALTTITASGDATFTGTGQIKLPAGTTAQRSGTPVEGMLRYNSDLDEFEGYVDGDWGGIGGGAEAGGAIMTNKSAASVSYVIEVGENGLSVGPITVNSGVTVTVSSGQRWLVL